MTTTVDARGIKGRFWATIDRKTVAGTMVVMTMVALLITWSKVAPWFARVVLNDLPQPTLVSSLGMVLPFAILSILGACICRFAYGRMRRPGDHARGTSLALTET